MFGEKFPNVVSNMLGGKKSTSIGKLEYSVFCGGVPA